MSLCYNQNFNRKTIVIQYENEGKNKDADYFNSMSYDRKPEKNSFKEMLGEIYKTNQEKIKKIGEEILFDKQEKTNCDRREQDEGNKHSKLNINYTGVICKNQNLENLSRDSQINASSILFHYHKLASENKFYFEKPDNNNIRQQIILENLHFIIKMQTSNKIYNTLSIYNIIEYLENTKLISFSLYKFRILIFLILLHVSKDNTILLALQNLDKIGLDVQSISEIEIDYLEKLISSVNFPRKKAIEIKQLTYNIINKSKGIPPENILDVLNLPGIDLNTAKMFFNFISETNKNIIVTSHVHRVSNRLNWVKSLNYERTQENLNSVIPFELRAGLNFVLDVFGQTICRKENPKCKECPLIDNCRFYKSNLKKSSNTFESLAASNYFDNYY